MSNAVGFVETKGYVAAFAAADAMVKAVQKLSRNSRSPSAERNASASWVSWWRNGAALSSSAGVKCMAGAGTDCAPASGVRPSSHGTRTILPTAAT